MGETLTPQTVRERLPPGWRIEGDRIVRTVEFDSYLAGVEFAAEVAALADVAFHHPKLVIEFRSVTVEFTSHEAGGITAQDLELAERVEAI